MMSLKDRISSPLEAGPSVHGGNDLPQHMVSALDYASKKLAKKALHLSLVVIRREYQLPLLAPASGACLPTGPYYSEPHTPALALTSNPPSAPTRSISAQSSFRSLNSRDESSASEKGRILERILVTDTSVTSRETAASPAFSEPSSTSASTASTAESAFSGLIWSQSSPYSTPATPATPFTVLSSTSAGTTDTGSVVSSAIPRDPLQFGMRFVSLEPTGMRKARVLKRVFEKTGKRFKLGDEWLPIPVCPSSLGLPPDLMHRSAAQREVVYSSEGITLLALDHLYTFKAALQFYAHNRSPRRLEDGVDELRRLVLANGRHKLLKSSLLENYRWLGSVDDPVLADVSRMYERAYGDNGLTNDDPAWLLPNMPLNLVDENPIDLVFEGTDAEEEGYDQSDFEMKLLEAAAAFTTRPARERHRAQTWDLDQGMILEKEVKPADASGDSDDLDLEEIENWYRQVDLGLGINRPSAAADETTSRLLADNPEADLEEMRRTTPKLSAPPSARGPVLKLQTTFSRGKKQPSSFNSDSVSATHAGVALSVPGKEEAYPEDEETEEELTARPKSAVHQPFPRPPRLDSLLSIDSMLSPAGGRISGSRQIHIGPATPNGYDDISPVTRGEWGFLMFQKSGRTAAVETC